MSTSAVYTSPSPSRLHGKARDPRDRLINADQTAVTHREVNPTAEFAT